MIHLIRTRITLIWLVLLGVTVLSWGIGHGITGFGPQVSGSAVLVATFVKVRFVLLDFMETRNAPLFLRITIECWVILIGTTLIALSIATPR